MNKIHKQLIDRYGKDQLIVTIEELSELAKELCKFLRNEGNVTHIVEEIADVENMLDQLKIYFNISSEKLEEMKRFKDERTKERML